MTASLKRLLIISDSYGFSNSGARLLLDLEKAFHGEGVICDFLDPDNNKVSNGRQIRFKKKQSLLLRGFSEIFLSIRFCKEIIFRDGELYYGVVSYSPSIFLVFPALIAKLKYKIPYYLILRDIVPQWLLQAGLINKGPSYFALSMVASLNYRVANFIGVQSETDLTFLKTTVTDYKKIHVLRNWRFLPKFVKASLPKNYKAAAPSLKIIYAGNVGAAQNMEHIFSQLLDINDHAMVTVDVYGFGWELEKTIQGLAGHRHANRIVFHKPIEEIELLPKLTEFDYGLVALDDRLTTGNLPSKIMTYLMGRLSILGVANNTSELRKLIISNNIGAFFETTELKKICKKKLLLELLIADPQRRQKKISHCLKKEFCPTRAAKMIISKLVSDGSLKK